MQTLIQNQFAAQRLWRWETKLWTTDYKKSLLKKLRSSIIKHEAEICQALFTDFQKPKAEVLLSEIYPVLSEIHFILKNLKKWSQPRAVASGPLLLGTRSQIHREARGTVLIISPWNYPFCLAMVPLVSAIAAGNTVILKPSELTPATSAITKKILSEVFESRLVSVFEGDKEVATDLLKLPFDHIFFTGSTQVGKIVMAAAAKNLSSVTLELGGKSPTIIHSSCDLALAVEKIVWGKFLNSGQTCIAPDYIFVEASIENKFYDLLEKEIRRQLGEKINAAIITEGHCHRLQAMTQESLDGGANSLLTLKEVSARRLTPTILKNPSLQSRVMQEEIFGPVLPILTFTNLQEPIRFIQDRPKPLALYIFAKDSAMIEQVLRQTSSGGACVNAVLIHYANHHLPFGGVGESGLGAYHGESGFRTFTHEKSVLRQGIFSRFEKLLYPPYSDNKTKLIQHIIRWLT